VKQEFSFLNDHFRHSRDCGDACDGTYNEGGKLQEDGSKGKIKRTKLNLI